MTDRIHTRREFLEAAGSGLTGMALSPGTVATPQARRPTPHRGVEIGVQNRWIERSPLIVLAQLYPGLPVIAPPEWLDAPQR